MARDGASGGVVRTVTVSSLYFCANFHAQFPLETEMQQSPELVGCHGLSYVGFGTYIQHDAFDSFWSETQSAVTENRNF